MDYQLDLEEEWSFIAAVEIQDILNKCNVIAELEDCLTS